MAPIRPAPVLTGSDSVRSKFISSLGFEPDAFQISAFDALDNGNSVVVAAPTGSGKTVVAEYAVNRAVEDGGKAFYTTPLKALSNQKYTDLVLRYGRDRVGLLTGDNAVNPSAPVVVMTTEVLRNMIYAGSSSLDGLRYVVLDEVHYLQNAYRGPVWEEVIIHTAPEVGLVCLSATVSNAEELADWIRAVRGPTCAVIEEQRPVELRDLYMYGDRSSEALRLVPTLVDGEPNPELVAADARPSGPAHITRARRGLLFAPRRPEVVEALDDADMLPCIYFIFSRAGCDEAVNQCLRSGNRLTAVEERRQIREIATERVRSLSAEDLRVLDYGRWLSGLEAGFAAHHAGLVPPLKEAVEACFAAGLVKVVFATETLSLGIHMPARTVVIEKLTKYTGERHEFLTPGEYTQLTGRAGRRGIDEVGNAVVLWSTFVPFEQVAGLVGARTFALTSSFRPTYNMAVNLVRRYTPDVAHHLLNLSFAQYRVDSDLVHLEAQLERSQHLRDLALAEAACELGDVIDYRRLVRTSEEAARQRPAMTAQVGQALEMLRPGDVLVVPGAHRSGGRFAVLSTSRRRGGDTRLRAISPERKLVSLSARDFPAPPRPIGRVDLPTPFAPNNASFQRHVASALRATRLGSAVPSTAPGDEIGHGPKRPGRRQRGEEAMAAAEAAAGHPVATCPALRAHLRAVERVERYERDMSRLERSISGRTESLARQFDRVLGVLRTRGYVENWSLTAGGQRLARLYHEADLLVAHCVDAGLLDGLGPAEMASLVSVFTYETRGPVELVPWFPTAELRRRWAALELAAAQLNADEERAGLVLTRRPGAGFVGLAHGWAAGGSLAQIIEDEEMSGGDFVRNIKQLIDLLRQLAQVVPDPDTATTARVAAEQLFRGVVAASSVLGSAGQG